MDTKQRYMAIVIGVSAGGFHTLSAILTKLPADYPVPVIIVQHRTKDQPELLEELLQEKCKIKVKQADEKEKISRSIVYIAPPNYHLLIENDLTFSLSTDDDSAYNKPSINVLFETAAATFSNRLAGIILTGSNNDGAMGMQAIKKAGGVTIAQDPQEAKYIEMPKAAIATNAIDFIYTIEQINQFLLTVL